MPRITAWQCPRSGNLFASKRAYLKHLKLVARNNLDHRKIEKIRAERADRLSMFRAGLLDVRDIEAYVLKHQRLLWDAARTNTAGFDHSQWKNIPVDWYPVVERLSFNLRYSDRVSNTHSCPLNGVTNWGGRTEGAPRGYPGYSGSVEWWTRFPTEGRTKKPSDHIAGSLFSERLVGIYTGTGGSGGGHKPGLVHYRYGVEIFLDDWDGLRKQHFLKTLAGRSVAEVAHCG